jgi:hypothetical protein
VFCHKSVAKPKGGRPVKDYLLTATAAKCIAASDSSETGRAILRALIDLRSSISTRPSSKVTDRSDERPLWRCWR